MSALEEWCFDNFGKMLIVLFLVVVGLPMSCAVVYEKNKRDEFMAECLQHEKHYACVSLWRAGRSR